MAIELTGTNFEQEVTNSDIPVLVDFWASWCGPCQMVVPVLDEISKEYTGKLKVGKVNVDEAPDLAAKYGVMSIPTLIVFKNGEVANQTVGALPKEKLVEFFNSYI